MRVRVCRPLLLALALSAAPLGAQEASPRAPSPAAEQDTPAQGRARLEQQVRARLGAYLRRALDLTDAQYARLTQTSARYEGTRRALLREERATRLELRAQLARGDAADQQRVATLMDALIAQQRRRLDLLAREQRDLAAFLTPVQRAKYAAVQERLRRRVEQLRERRLQAPARVRGRARGNAPGIFPGPASLQTDTAQSH